MRKSTILLCLIVFCSGCNSNSGGSKSTSPSTPTYTSFDAPGVDTSISPSCATHPTDINAASVIVGTFYPPLPAGRVLPTQGFIRSPDGTFRVVAGPQAQTSLSAINSSGTALGATFAPSSSPCVPGWEVFTLTGAQFSNYVPPYSQFPVTQVIPTSINDSGQFVGSLDVIVTQNGLNLTVSQAFVNSTDNLLQVICCSLLGLFGPPTFAHAFHININGDVVGDYGGGGFLYHTNDQSFLTLNAPALPGAGAPGTTAIDINSSGTIVGTVAYQPPNSAQHSFLRTNDGTYTLFDPPGMGSGSSLPVRINASGQIAGNFIDSVLVSHGYLRNPDGSFIIIDEPDTVPASNYGTFVTGMNDSGTVVGYYYDYRTVCHGFVRK